MENKLSSPVIERSYRRRYYQMSPSASPHSDNLTTKIHSVSTTPGNMYRLQNKPYTFLSKFEKEIYTACKATHAEPNTPEEKADFFMTELDERIDFLKANPPVPRTPLDFLPIKPRSVSQKKITEPPPPFLPLDKRRRRKVERKSSLEDLMKTSNNFQSKTRGDIIIKLQKSLGAIKTPCIEALYAEISRKEHSFEVYKNIRNREEIDPFIAFNHACTNEKIPPIPLLSHIQDNSLVLNRYRISDPIANALSGALSLMPYLQKLHLDENAISDAGGGEIIKALAQQSQIASFFYTHNEFGKKMCDTLKPFLKSCPLTELNFRGAKCLGNSAFEIIDSLSACKTLKKLYLSELGLSDACMLRFDRYIKRSKIIELDLSWNQISEEASLNFFKVLKRNKHLTMLDYSWNNLGPEESNACIILNYVLIQHPNLMHINLSYTQLTDSNFLSLAPGLQSSKTLVCAHFTGNHISQKRVNTMMIQLVAVHRTGFIPDSGEEVIHPLEAVGLRSRAKSQVLHNVKFRDRTGKSVQSHRDTLANISHSSNYRDRLSGKNCKEVIFSRYLGESTLKETKNWGVSEHCWICERWSPYGVKINTQIMENVTSINKFQWNSQVDTQVKIKCSFNLWEDIPMEMIGDNKYEYVGILPPGLHRFWVVVNNTEVCVSKQISRRNWGECKANEMNVPIRNYDLEPIVEIREVKNVFDKNKSVFKTFVEDTEVTRKIMFNNDKKHLKLPKIIKNESALNAVYDVLLSNFTILKEIFDATSAESSYPNIGWFDFNTFCDKCQLLDNRNLNKATIDICFVAVNVDEDDLDDNPAQELCRYEFLEVIVRMALYKYKDLPLTQAEMTSKLIAEHISKYADPSKAIKFRREKLYTYEVNTILEANLSQFQTLFTKIRERAGKWISLEGYKKMISKTGIALRDEAIIKAYAFSKMSILDEMAAADAYDRMVFVEFLESIGRLSNQVFEDTDMTLAEMVDRTISMIFAKYRLKKKVPELLVDSDSEANID